MKNSKRAAHCRAAPAAHAVVARRLVLLLYYKAQHVLSHARDHGSIRVDLLLLLSICSAGAWVRLSQLVGLAYWPCAKHNRIYAIFTYGFVFWFS